MPFEGSPMVISERTGRDFPVLRLFHACYKYRPKAHDCIIIAFDNPLEVDYVTVHHRYKVRKF